jgi:hypothetical protein
MGAEGELRLRAEKQRRYGSGFLDLTVPGSLARCCTIDVLKAEDGSPAERDCRCVSRSKAEPFFG